MTEVEKQELKNLILNEVKDETEGVLMVYLRAKNSDLGTRIAARVKVLLEVL